MSKVKKVLKWFLIGVGITVLLLCLVIVGFVYFGLLGGPAKKTRDIADYEKIFNEQELRTGYMTFPESIPEGVVDVDFFHLYRNTICSPTVETFLQCTYDEETYNQEIERLENTSKVYGNVKKELLRDENNNYNYPVYIAVENAARAYEYVLLTGERQLTYIFTMYGTERSVHFDKKYLPKDYQERADEEPVYGGGYSIYYKKVTSGMIDTDYTRTPISQLTGAHMKEIDDDSFIVYYNVNASGKEIITGCSFWKEMEETPYHDIDSCEYVSMTLDRDNMTVTVTYLQDEKENKRVYNIK